MTRSFVAKFTILLMIVLLGTSLVYAQSIVARSNQAALGQKSIFTVVGSSMPLCLNLAQFDNFGNLWTLSSYYIAPFSTMQIAPPTIPFKTTSVFAYSDPVGVGPASCAGTPGPSLTDPLREPQIYQQLVGGSAPTVTVNQLNAAIGIAVAYCRINSGNISITQGNGNGDTATVSSVTLSPRTSCTSLVGAEVGQFITNNVNQVVVFGFEELTFGLVAGDPIAAGIAKCTNTASAVPAAGSSWYLTCGAVTGGLFGQTLP